MLAVDRLQGLQLGPQPLARKSLDTGAGLQHGYAQRQLILRDVARARQSFTPTVHTVMRQDSILGYILHT